MGSEVTDLPKGFKLTDSPKECVEIIKRDMERSQMLAFVHGSPGSGKTTTARLLVSERNLEEFTSCVFRDFQESPKRISPQVKRDIVPKFVDA